MHINEAVEKIQAILEEKKAQIAQISDELVLKTRIIFADKYLNESNSFNEKMVLLMGILSVGTEDTEEGEFCDYSICVAIKTGLVSEEELNKEAAGFEAESSEFAAELEKAGSIQGAIDAIAAAQLNAAKAAAAEYELTMKKTKLKLYLSFGALALIFVAVLIISILVK